MIAADREWAGQSGEEAAFAVTDRARPAMHRHGRADDAAAERSADGLMAEADAQNRNAAGELLNDGHTAARFGRRTRSRREDDGHGPVRGDLVRREGVVADDERFLPQPPQIAGQVVDEAVVVVDQQQHLYSNIVT